MSKSSTETHECGSPAPSVHYRPDAAETPGNAGCSVCVITQADVLVIRARAMAGPLAPSAVAVGLACAELEQLDPLHARARFLHKVVEELARRAHVAQAWRNL